MNAGIEDVFQCGLSMVADLERSLQDVDALLLTGRPHAIADAAKAMELSLSTAEPAIQRIVLALETLGAPRLRDAAQQLRGSDQANARRGSGRSEDSTEAFRYAKRCLSPARPRLGPRVERIAPHTPCTRLGGERPPDRRSLASRA